MINRLRFSVSRYHAPASAPVFRFPRGFSIVEVMVSLVLLAVGATLALPSYREMVEKRQLTHGAEQLASFINTAQGEAVKQNRVLTVSYARSADDAWCVGAVLGESACDCTESLANQPDFCAIDAVPWQISNANVGDTDLVKSMSGDGAYTFDPVRGIFVDRADALAVEMRSNSEDYRLDLVVNHAGQAVLCSRQGYEVPGYAVCSGGPGEADVDVEVVIEDVGGEIVGQVDA